MFTLCYSFASEFLISSLRAKLLPLGRQSVASFTHTFKQRTTHFETETDAETDTDTETDTEREKRL